VEGLQPLGVYPSIFWGNSSRAVPFDSSLWRLLKLGGGPLAAAAAAMPQRIGLRFMLPLLSMANNRTTSRQGVLSVETTHTLQLAA